MLFGLFGCKRNLPPSEPAFRFRVEEIFYIKPPVDRVILVGTIEEGTIRTGASALVRTQRGDILVTVEAIETINEGEIKAAVKGRQVGLRLLGIRKDQAQQGDVVVAAVTASASITPPSGGTNAQTAQTHPAANPWLGLRNLVLTLKPEELGVASGSADTYGFVMDIGYTNKDTKVTVVALRDGTMSLYLSSGGGTLGTGQRSPQAANLAKDVVAAVKEYVGKMEKTTTFPIPATGRVRFFILTGQGVYTTETDLASLEQREDSLFPLFAGGQNILTQIRLASEATQPSQAK